MKLTIKLSALLTALVVNTACAVNPIVINDNGAWCWFQDERAIIHNGEIFVASVASKRGTDGQNRSGNIEVARYSLDNSSPSKVSVLHNGLEDDDHNVPALLSLDSDDILAVYTKHNTDRNIRLRSLNTSGDNQWNREVSMPRKDKVTYANLVRLSEGNNGKPRIYNFYRGLNFNPTFDISDDEGKTWSKGHHFIANKGRPYVKYIGNNKDEIHFITTEQHPRVFNNSIYHGILKGNKVLNSQREMVHDMNQGPLNVSSLSKVFQGDADNVAWTVDLHLDENSAPYALFSVQVGDGDKQRSKGQMHGDDMRYFFASFDASGKNNWQVAEIAYAGSRLYDKEQDYTGLAALVPGNKNLVFISTNADPVSGLPLISKADGKRHWEIFSGERDSEGKWKWNAVTEHSITDNLRPIVPINNESADVHLLWMQGKYYTYIDIDTKIVMQTNPHSLH